MKKLCTTLLLCLAGITTFAQAEFAPVGAKWSYYKMTFQGGGIGMEKFVTQTCDSSYTSAGRTIKIIQSKIRQQKLFYTSSHAYAFSDRTTTYKTDSIYEQNDTVFLYNKLFEKYTPLYIFNVQAGDTIRLPAFDTVLAEESLRFSDFVTAFDSTFTFRVTAVDTVNYNGNALKTIFTEPVIEIDPSSFQDYGGMKKTLKPVCNWGTDAALTWVINPYPGVLNGPDSMLIYFPKGGYAHNLGGLGAGLIPEFSIASDFNALAHLQYFHWPIPLICYEDSTFSYFNLSPSSNTSCDSFNISTPLGLKMIDATSNIKIYPNPAQHILHVEVAKAARDMHFKVVSQLGSIVVEHTALKEQQNTIDISMLPTGIYLAIIETDGERYYHKFVKQ